MLKSIKPKLENQIDRTGVLEDLFRANLNCVGYTTKRELAGALNSNIAHNIGNVLERTLNANFS